jgi:hypothetical protein
MGLLPRPGAGKQWDTNIIARTPELHADGILRLRILKERKHLGAASSSNFH